jgi:phosphohistidine phosphatase
MKLYLIQHGEAVSKETDPDRPLSDKGRHDVERLAAFLARQRVTAMRVFHSTKARARQTAGLLTEWAIGRHVDRVDLEPETPVAPLAEEVAQWDEDTALVGHLPFLSRLASRLVCGSEDAEVAAFEPGAALCLERGTEGRWWIVWMVRPELLVAEESKSRV